MITSRAAAHAAVHAYESRYHTAYTPTGAATGTPENRRTVEKSCWHLAVDLYHWYGSIAGEEYRTALWMRRAVLHGEGKGGEVYTDIDAQDWMRHVGAKLSKRRRAALLSA